MLAAGRRRGEGLDAPGRRRAGRFRADGDHTGHGGGHHEGVQVHQHPREHRIAIAKHLNQKLLPRPKCSNRIFPPAPRQRVGRRKDVGL